MNDLDSSPDALARRCAAAMYEGDRTAQAFGMEIAEVGAGTATLRMAVDERMINGHALCHGGMIFTLADTAFAYACNAYNQVTVAQHCSITYIAPARLGDRLTARAVERTRNGRSGIYDITVTNQEVARLVNTQVQQIGGRQVFDKQVEASGIGHSAVLDFFRQQILRDKVATEVVERERGRLTVEREVRAKLEASLGWLGE